MAADARSTFRPTGAELGPLLDGLATCVIWLDAAGVVLHLNEPAEDLLEQSRNQAVGRGIRELLRGNAELEGVIERARAAGAQYSRRELQFETGPAAPPRFVDLTVTPYDAPGHPGGAIVEIADVTQHQRILRVTSRLRPGTCVDCSSRYTATFGQGPLVPDPWVLSDPTLRPRM